MLVYMAEADVTHVDADEPMRTMAHFRGSDAKFRPLGLPGSSRPSHLTSKSSSLSLAAGDVVGSGAGASDCLSAASPSRANEVRGPW
jgi:hypothetical protein